MNNLFIWIYSFFTFGQFFLPFVLEGHLLSWILLVENYIFKIQIS